MAQRYILQEMDELKNYVVLLSGGVGSRLQGYIDVPKQYAEAAGLPIILYSLMTIESCDAIAGVVVVADPSWVPFCREHMEQHGIKKVLAFAEPGEMRQNSIHSGLRALSRWAKNEDIVIVHDAARPGVTKELLERCIEENRRCDGVIPCLPMKDTVYESTDGVKISKLLKRNTLFAGQAPESFVFGKYYSAHGKYSEAELGQFSGSSEIAIREGMTIHMIEGDEANFKITTPKDLDRFRTEIV